MVIFATSEPVSADDDTAPLPVIRAEPAPSVSVGRTRGPFEPPDQSAEPAEAGSAAVPAGPVNGGYGPAVGAMAGAREIGQAAESAASAEVAGPEAAKLDQIKDLYLTAEAIGDDALAQHFQQVSDRQRQLIREYFDQATASRADDADQN
jgi:hypothetical protein